MFRNQIHPVTLFSLFIASFAMLALGVGGEIYREKLRYTSRAVSWDLEELLIISTFLGVGTLMLVGALGMWLKQNWARHLVQFGFMLAGLGWLAFIWFIGQENTSHLPWVVFTGMTACILGLVLGGILFLNNRSWVLPYFSVYAPPNQSREVLDEDW